MVFKLIIDHSFGTSSMTAHKMCELKTVSIVTVSFLFTLPGAESTFTKLRASIKFPTIREEDQQSTQ